MLGLEKAIVMHDELNAFYKEFLRDSCTFTQNFIKVPFDYVNCYFKVDIRVHVNMVQSEQLVVHWDKSLFNVV